MVPARHCDIQLNPQNKYRNARKQELEHMCKQDMRCALVAQRTRARVKRALGMKTSIFTHFVSISRILYFVYLNIILFSLAFIHLKVLIFLDLLQLKNKDFRGPISISRTFTALKPDF